MIIENSPNVTSHVQSSNKVEIIDKCYLEKRFYTTELETSIKDLSLKFNLNEDQSRAFQIIAHHVVLPTSAQLKMHIGGMGGTGKSRVINAITNYFAYRIESFRFMIVAPTGSASALLGGSTYHSAFGINEKNRNSNAKGLSQVYTRLKGVDYIFLDEVSMLSAYDLYKISSQLC
ncbi:hypothetical protein M378DRAFT_93128, partial [Amanita muscaria Koide BX008]